MHCLFCQSDQIKKASYPRATEFNGKRFDYLECKSCGLIFIDPLPAGDDYAKMYAKEYHDEFYFKEGSLDYSKFHELLEKNISDKTLVDYGCGDGSFLNFFSQKGYRCIGIEYDKDLVNRLKARFPQIEFYTVDEFNSRDKSIKYGAIYMGDVLEHLSDPFNFLTSIKAKLNNNGLLLVQGPLENNFTLSLVYRRFVSFFRFGKVSAHVPYHISFSNVANQKAIFEKSGFSTVHYKITEINWPLPTKASANPVTLFKWLVARTSVGFSSLFPSKMGNRFIYLGKSGGEK